MKGTYKGCEIEVLRDECEFLTFAIFDNGYEVTSGFSDCSDTVRDFYNSMKNIVDDYRENPQDYE